MVFLSLGLLVRTSGQVSLAQVSFMAIGVCAMSYLVNEQGLNWWLALLLSGAVAIPVGALLAIPAIRLSGLYLALATFGFGILLQFMFYTEDFMFGSFGAGLMIPRPSAGLESDRNFYYLMVAFAVVTAVAMLVITRSRLGRLLRSMTDSPTGLSTAGASINVTRVLVFCLSAFIAAVAGALHGATVTFVSGDSYQPILSLILFVTVVVSIGRDPWYAVIAAFVVFVFPSLPLVFTQGPNIDGYITIVIGLLALFIGFRPAMVALFARLPLPTFGTGKQRRHGCSQVGRSPAVGAPRRARRSARGGQPAGPVRRPGRCRRCDDLGPHRPDHRADRPERRRQDHDLQRLLRPDPAHQRHGRSSTGTTPDGSAPPPGPGADSAGRSSRWSCSTR